MIAGSAKGFKQLKAPDTLLLKRDNHHTFGGETSGKTATLLKNNLSFGIGQLGKEVRAAVIAMKDEIGLLNETQPLPYIW